MNKGQPVNPKSFAKSQLDTKQEYCRRKGNGIKVPFARPEIVEFRCPAQYFYRKRI